METAVAALIVLTIVLFGVLTLTYAYISSQDTIMESWREMEGRLGDRARTSLSPITASANLLGTQVYVTLRNDGDTKLTDFDQWDVIVQYDTNDNGDFDAVQWFTYYDGMPMNGEWTTAIGEVFEPDIFNPGEAMTITIRPSAEISRTGVAIIGTPNGITASKDFTR